MASIISAGTTSGTSLNLSADTSGVLQLATNGTTTAVTIDTSQNVGIGTASPQSSLQVSGAVPSAPTGTGVHLGIQSSYALIQLNGGAGAGSVIDFSQSGTDYLGRILYDNTSNYMFFATNTAERMRIDSSGRVLVGLTSANTSGSNFQVSQGITFPATQSASSDANTLDDYEEGTWTATLLCTSGTITVNAGNNTGLYTKIGRTVNISGYIDVSSVSSPSGRLRLNGIPFIPVSDGAPVGICYLTTTNAFTGVPWCLGEVSNTHIYIDRNAGTGADPAVDLASAMKAGSEVYFNFTYTTT